MFCHICGRAYALRFPGCYLESDPPERIKAQLSLPPDERTLEWHQASPMGDPESGPRTMRCPAGHDPFDQAVEDAAMGKAGEIIGDFLEQIATGERNSPEDPEIPMGVSEAARILIEHREKAKAHWDAYMTEHYPEPEDFRLQERSDSEQEDQRLLEACVQREEEWDEAVAKDQAADEAEYGPRQTPGERAVEEAHQAAQELAASRGSWKRRAEKAEARLAETLAAETPTIPEDPVSVTRWSNKPPWGDSEARTEVVVPSGVYSEDEIADMHEETDREMDRLIDELDASYGHLHPDGCGCTKCFHQMTDAERAQGNRKEREEIRRNRKEDDKEK